MRLPSDTTSAPAYTLVSTAERKTSKPAPTPEALPSVTELGRALAAIEAEYWALDADISDDNPVKEHRMAVLGDQEDALRALISTLPAVTLTDAAVQIAAADNMAACLYEADWTSAEVQARFDSLRKALCRIIVSVLPVIAKAAGLDMGAMGWADNARMRQIRLGIPEGRG